MKQIVLIGDIHLGVKNNNKEYFEQMVSYIETEVFGYILKNKKNINCVIFLGDLFDSREHLNVFIGQETKLRIFDFFEKNQIKVFFIAGNHDLFYKNENSHSSLQLFKNDSKYVEIVMENKVIEFGGKKIELCGYLSEPKKLGDYLFGHFDIKTFKMNQQLESQEGYDPVFFSNYEKVKSGHYHYTSSKHNIEYIGSLFWLTQNDYKDTKKFKVIFEDFTEKDIFNVVSPRFVKVGYYEKNNDIKITLNGIEEEQILTNQQDALKKISNNYILLTVEDYNNVELLDEFKEKITNLYDVLNKKVISPDGKILKKVQYTDLKSGIESYFEETVFPDNINIEKIKNKTLQLYESVLQQQKGIL